MYGMGIMEFILKVHFLMDPGGYRAIGFRRERRHGARGAGTLQRGGGDLQAWGSIEEDYADHRLTTGIRLL
jgi:hypothetical protein